MLILFIGTQTTFSDKEKDRNKATIEMLTQKNTTTRKKYEQLKDKYSKIKVKFEF